jgi:hypothetical protein
LAHVKLLSISFFTRTNRRRRRETVQGAAGQGGDDVRVADGEDTINGKLKVEILSDMDAEIAALEEKMSKARQVKAGMMSVLLTGKIRLVES